MSAHPPSLTMKEIEKLTDADYLRRGLEYHDQKMVENPARHGDRLYAEVKGSGKSNYRVTIAFEDKLKASCTCVSARRTAFCKHAIAVMVSWSKTPDAFVESEAPPFLTGKEAGKKKKASVKKGKTETGEVREKGVEAVERLLTEIASTGLSALTRERVQLVRELAEETRNYKLVRLSAALLTFAETLEQAVSAGDFSLTRYAEQMTDILFTAKAVRKYYKDGAQDERILEDLIGKSWRKTSLPTLSDLRLVEVGYTSYETPDDFRIDESVFFCLTNGAFYSEKQILPPQLKKKEAPKPSYAGDELHVGTAYLYPGYPPARIKIEDLERRPLSPEAFEKFNDYACADWGRLLSSYLEARKDIFAPAVMPALLNPAKVVCAVPNLLLYDAHAAGIPILLSAPQIDQLCRQLSNGKIRLIFGQLTAANQGICFEPTSIVIEKAAGRTIATMTQPASP
jgi:hypothetical protein